MAQLDTWFSTRRHWQFIGWTLLLVVALSPASILTTGLKDGFDRRRRRRRGP